MSNYIFPTNIATKLKYGPWTIGLWLSNEIAPGIGLPLVLGYESEDGWIVVATIAGPWQPQTWTANVQAEGGMGNFIVNRFPSIKAALKRHFDTTPELPVITNATPFSPEAFNQMLYEYIAFEDLPGTGHPTVVVKAYQPA